MRMAYFLFTIGAAIALSAACAQARPGPGMLSEASNRRTLLNFSSDEPHPEEAEGAQVSVEETGPGSEKLPERKTVDDAVQLKATDTQTESDKTEEAEEEDGVVCTEMGTCYEKRLLTATIDYKNDGPNNPITDPPH